MIMSRHAAIRAQQRGITTAQLSAVFIHADREIRRGNSCYAIWVSKETLQQLGPITPEGVPTDKLKTLTVLQSEDETCVTAFRSQRGKAYRRRSRRARHAASKSHRRDGGAAAAVSKYRNVTINSPDSIVTNRPNHSVW
jgi:hypothetical protein